MPTRRVVLDTSVLVSRILLPESVPARVVSQAVREAVVLISDELAAEIFEVLSRPKFAAYVDPGDARSFVQTLGGIAERVELTAHVRACRDPGDDHILALAVSGSADVIVSGDRDLLDLSPFQGIPTLTPKEFLEGMTKDKEP